MSDRVNAPMVFGWTAAALAVPEESRRPLRHALEAAASILGGFDFPRVDISGRRVGTSRIEPADDFESAGVASLQALGDALELLEGQEAGEKEPAAGAPGVVRCTKCGRELKSVSERPGHPEWHLDLGGESCDGVHSPGRPLEDPDDADDAANPYGLKDQDLAKLSEPSGAEVAIEAHRGGEEATGRTRGPVEARRSDITMPRVRRCPRASRDRGRPDQPG